MRCPPVIDVQSYIDEELSAGHAARIVWHLEQCQACRAKAHDLAATASLLHVLAKPPVRSVPIPASPAAPVKPRWAARLLWVVLPAAACLVLVCVTTWRYFFPAGENSTFIAAFVEAHRALPAEGGLLAPCDFGLGGRWR